MSEVASSADPDDAASSIGDAMSDGASEIDVQDNQDDFDDVDHEAAERDEQAEELARVITSIDRERRDLTKLIGGLARAVGAMNRDAQRLAHSVPELVADVTTDAFREQAPRRPRGAPPPRVDMVPEAVSRRPLLRPHANSDDDDDLADM
jgi:hypothetical protein